MSESSTLFRMSLFFFLFSLFLISCSQVSPELNFSTSSVVFDYKDEESLPSARLSVFTDVSSDEHRAETIKIESLSDGFEWESSSPLKIENEDRKYAGYTNFVMPDENVFPEGRYKVTYIDAAAETAETLLNVSYNQDISKMNAKEVASYMSNLVDSENLAVYGETGILLYYGQKWSDDMDAVWERFPDAVFARDVWAYPESGIICLMPKIYKNKVKN